MPRKNNNARVVARKPRRSAAVAETTTPTRTAAEDKLWEALRAHPGATTDELTMQAGIGKSTAGKILTAWNADGSVERTSSAQSGGRRGAARWTIPAGPDGEASAAEDSVDATTPMDAPPSPVSVDGTSAAVPGGSEPTAAGTGSSTDEQATAPAAATDSSTPTAKAPRLGKGALRGMVEDYLSTHSGEAFSPNAIGKALDRSSGAVNNALEKLVTDGYAIRTQDKPKRFAINPEK